MKKALLLLIISVLGFGAYAQQCQPDTTIKDPGIYPNYLDTATVGEAYEHVLQILAIRDTQVTFGGTTITAQVDSIKLVTIEGLPANFNYGCEPPSCTFTYLAVGCAKITGSPTAAEAGVHPLSIVVTSYAQYSGIPLTSTDTLTDFVLVVNDTAVNSVELLSPYAATLAPNPSSNGMLTIQATAPIQQVVIHDQNGRAVSSFSVDNQRFYRANLHQLSSGVYQVAIRTDQGLIRKRWMRL